MKKSDRFFVTALLLGAYLLSACTGTAPKQDDSSQGTPNTQSHEVVFTGTVQSMGGAQWMISGEQVQVDGSTAIDANIKAGDIVKVEAVVSPEGTILALKVESSGPDDTVDDNSNSANDNAANSNDDNANSNDNTNTGNDNANSNANSNEALDDGQEISGVVEAITDSTITVGGVTYNLTDITEFKDPISLGDLVKIHVIITADGILIVREIETTPGTGIGGEDNGNSNDNGDDNGNDDNSNSDDDSNGNSNDDNGGNSNGNSNDDNGGSNSNSNDND